MTLVAFALQYDAFSKIDGGGAGRGGDDRKIDLSEWLAGYRGVTDHGFVGLKGLSGDAAAELLFMKMDNNGGGVVRFLLSVDFLFHSFLFHWFTSPLYSFPSHRSRLNPRSRTILIAPKTNINVRCPLLR